MDPIIIFALIGVGIFAGIVGAIFGLGGGIIFVPFLTVAFGLPADEAAAVSLVAIVASSVGASSSYVKEGRSNIKLGLLLETTTTVGAMLGAVVAGYLENWILLCVFSFVLIYISLHMMLHKEHIYEPAENDGENLTFSYTDDDGCEKYYKTENIKGGLAGCAMAGMLSSMTGVGGGAIKVPMMNIYMHVPIKVASATSNYMIGITAFAGVVVFFLNGTIPMDYAAALAIGAFVGALVGVKLSEYINGKHLRKYLAILLLAVAVIELLKAGGIL
jgi:uncharacterized membrane protein YfcA